MRHKTILIASLSLLVAWWSLRSDEQPQTESTASPSPTASAAHPLDTRALQVTPVPTQVQAEVPQQGSVEEPVDRFAYWRTLEQQHQSRRVADPTWARETQAAIAAYFAKLNEVFGAKENYERFVVGVNKIDCREGACLVQLDTRSSWTAAAYLEMLHTDRIKHQFMIGIGVDCRPQAYAEPTIPGEEVTPFSVLVRFDCDPPLPRP